MSLRMTDVLPRDRGGAGTKLWQETHGSDRGSILPSLSPTCPRPVAPRVSQRMWNPQWSIVEPSGTWGLPQVSWEPEEECG